MGSLFKHSNDLMLTVGIKQLSRGRAIITDAVREFPASFVWVIAACAAHWAEFSLRDPGFYDAPVRHEQLRHLSQRRGGLCEREEWSVVGGGWTPVSP